MAVRIKVAAGKRFAGDLRYCLALVHKACQWTDRLVLTATQLTFFTYVIGYLGYLGRYRNDGDAKSGRVG